MKINKPKNNRSRGLKYSLIALGVVVIIGVSVAAWLKFNTPQQNTSKDGPNPEQQKQMQAVDNDKKKAFAESTKDVDNPGVTVPTPTSPDSIELTASKTDATTVTVLTKLKNYASGTCDLTITNGSKTYPANVPIIYQPEYSTCAGFSVPIADLGAGTWTIKLVATPTGSAAVTKSIDLEIQ